MMLTIAAGTTDVPHDPYHRQTRQRPNGYDLIDESLFQPWNNTVGWQLPLVFPGTDVDPDGRGCSTLPDCSSLLDDVKGKVVLYEISYRAKMRSRSTSLTCVLQYFREL
jgi:hypothetical protein